LQLFEQMMSLQSEKISHCTVSSFLDPTLDSQERDSSCQ